MIKVVNLTKKFGNITAVNNVSFEVEKGKIWGFLGPNGAGKTTTMRILTGYLPASEGTAMIAGIDVSRNADAVKHMVGYLPENVPIYPELTVKEHLHFIAELFGIKRSRIPEAVARAVERTNLKEVYRRLARNISRGYRQRLGIAQAIIHEPQVLILDEPTIGLDPAQIIEIRDLIKSFAGNATVILSSHILTEIAQVCDGAVIIKAGRLLSYITREEWGKNLEIITADPISQVDPNEFARRFPFISEAKADAGSLKLEFKEAITDINQVLNDLIQRKIRITEVKTGLEALYIKVVSREQALDQRSIS